MTCPNVKKPSLLSCAVLPSSSSNSQGRSRHSITCDGDSTAFQPAPSTTTLVLEDTILPDIDSTPAANTRITRHRQHTLNVVEQLRSSLPNLHALHIMDWNPTTEAVDAWEIWGSQIKELHIPYSSCMFIMEVQGICPLQQLRVLQLKTYIPRVSELKQLLQLSCLEHLELQTLYHVTEDLSEHPCSWQCLHLHLDYTGLDLPSLAFTPLHSLQKPLRLGSDKPGARCQVWILPADSLAVVQTLAAKLLQCGVSIQSDALWHGGHCGPRIHGSNEQHRVALLSAISPALGPKPKVVLADMQLGKHVIEALAVTHRHTMKCLALHSCALDDDMVHTALTQLPLLSKLEVVGCESLTQYNVSPMFCDMVTAMAQQPAGRTVEVWLLEPTGNMGPEQLLRTILFATRSLQHEVHVTCREAVQAWYRKDETWKVLSYTRRSHD